MKVVLIGMLGRAHGLRGDVGVMRFNPESECWDPSAGPTLLVLPASTPAKDEAGRPLAVVDARPERRLTLFELREGAKGRSVARFAELADRGAAEALKGRLLAIELEQLDAPEADEVYVHEAIGWAVESSAGEAVGQVIGATHTHVDLIEVRPIRGGESFYVPLVDPIVTEVDRAGRRFVVDAEQLEGLMS